ncbi:MAG: right-handed parallel beta-helix repeat-containing protein [Bacteroidales bacterium]|nr:right-handed parallel beta-helix repeat-containing protein [Bacteroidales bacterium]
MKKFYALLFCMALFGYAMSTDVSGVISVNTTWNLAGSPYVVTGDITVNNGVTLTIDANVVVKFNSSRKLIVLGTLNATSATFTSNLATPAPGDWQFIQTGNGTYAATVNLTNCFLRYAQQFYIENGTATLSGTNIEYVYYYGVQNKGVLNMTGGVIDMAGYSSSGNGITTASGSVSTLNSVTIIHGFAGINLIAGAQANITSCNFNLNQYPVYYSGAASLSVSGTCNFTGNTYDAFYVNHGSHSGTWTLPTTTVPYYFNNGYTVNNGSTLVIGADNILKFKLNDVLNVYGTLTANPSAGHYVYFTSERDDNWGGDTNNDGTNTAPASRNWTGIKFYNESNDASVMRRCLLRYAGAGNIGGISLYDAGPTIDYCELQQNYFGAYFQYASTPNFTNNTIGSSELTPIAMSFEANPTFSNNVLSFSDNTYDAIGLLGGTLTANANLIKRNFTTVTNITYVMLADIIVPAGRTLTIAPGIVIKYSSSSHRIVVQGKLTADATSSEWITLTSVKDDNFGNPMDTNKDGTITSPSLGDVGAIIFASGYDPTSKMDYVRMKYAQANSYYYPNGGENHYIYTSAVAVINPTVPTPAGPTISNCEFRDLTYGICCYQASNPIISNNAMINITNTPFAISASANPTFSGNTFTNVTMNALGLIGNNVVVNGTISKRTVAGYTNITYVLLENLTVKNLTNLTIDPGVVIKMYNKTIYVDGGFKCSGTVSEKIIFTSLYDDNVGNPMDTNGDGNATAPATGNWAYIQYRDNSDDVFNTVTYTNFLFGGYSNEGVFKTLNASPTLSNSLIDHSYYGVYVDGNSAPLFNTLAIQNCNLDPIAMSLTSNPTFTNISFSANGSNGIRIIEGNNGTLSSNATLVKRNVAGFTNIPYIIRALNIASGAVLTLESGIIIKMQSSGFQAIFVHGGLNATGVSGQKIYFTSLKDDSVGGDTNNDGNGSIPGNNDWHGIIFYPESSDANNKIIYSEIRYTGGGYSDVFGSYSTKGAVRIKDAYAQIDHTVLQQGYLSAFGIYGSANPSISNCQIYNFDDEPVYMAMFSNPVFSNNSISNIGLVAIGIQPETYSQTASIPQRSFAGYSNITYMFYGATINSGTTITIPAGTVFKSTSQYELAVNGKLTISGSSGSRMVFTDYRDDSYGNPLDTEQNGSATAPNNSGAYITFNDVSDDASTINYMLMRYTGNGIRLNSASPSITNSTFYKMNYGITNSGVCTPVINNNTFNDLYYAPLSISLVSYPASSSGNIISGTTYKCIKVNNETLTQDVTLPKRNFGGVTNIPYFFDYYTIGTGVTLTISPGVVCKFWSSGGITVNNGLIAEGSATNAGNIVFTTITDDFHGGDSNSDGTATPYNYYSWSGITINDVALDPLTRFENCIFRYANGSYGAIRTISSSPSILNCNFNNCSHGVYATAASNPLINNCDFYNLSSYGVNNVNQSFVINAENCWWGSNTGPTHSGNPGGTGEPVTNSVDYLPYGTSGVINPLMGDVSLNGIIQAYDASLVLQHVVTPFLSSKQLVVADVSGSSGATAFDASLILQYVVNLISYFPAELLSPVPQYQAEAELMIANVNVQPGQEFIVPVSLANASGVFSMQMEFQYDPVYIQAPDIENLIPGMNVNYTVIEDEGVIRVAIAGISQLQGSLDVINLKFKASDVMLIGQTFISASDFLANETDLSENIHPGTIMISGISTGLDLNKTSNGSLHCYPNPAKDFVTISYAVSSMNENVFIGVYDITGKLVSEIVNGIHDASVYRLNWNTTDSRGSLLPAGLYFVKRISSHSVETQKIQLVR